MIHHQPTDNFQQFPGRNYMTPAEIQEYHKVFNGGGSSSTSMMPNLPVPPQVHYTGVMGGGSSFTISGLNLNLGGGGGGAMPQPLMRAAPPPTLLNQQDVNSAMLNGGDHHHHQGGYGGGDMNGGNTMNNRFMGMDQCTDLDNYWTSY